MTTPHPGARATEQPKADKPLDVGTDLAFERSRLAAERTLMAWIRTSLSMIGFGLHHLQILSVPWRVHGQHGATPWPLEPGSGHGRVGRALAGAGHPPALGLPEKAERAGASQVYPSLALVTAGLIELIGIGALLSLFLRWGPF